VLDLPGPAVALLAVLMLRGPQTAGELRGNTDRLHKFADISTVEGYLRELAARAAGALVVELARLPGTRETRWAHLLSGPVAGPRPDDAAPTYGRAGDAAAGLPGIEARLRSLEAQVEELHAALTAVTDELRSRPH
jgi:uncharacterized protein YceH (UPF0502 family)